MPVNIYNIIKNANWQEESQPAISDLVFLCLVLVYRSVCSDGCVSNFSSVVWMGSECLQLHYCEYTWIVTVGNHSKLMLTYKKHHVCSWLTQTQDIFFKDFLRANVISKELFSTQLEIMSSYKIQMYRMFCKETCNMSTKLALILKRKENH